jgi:hypothetical protein
MKAFEQIRLELVFLRSDLIVKKRQHANLHQIDMLSSEGNKLRELISETKGMIRALEWIINDHLNVELCEHYLTTDE